MITDYFAKWIQTSSLSSKEAKGFIHVLLNLSRHKSISLKPQTDLIEQENILLMIEVAGGTVVRWLTLSPHSKKVQGLNPGQGLSVWSLHVCMFYLCLQGFSPGTSAHTKVISDNLATCPECTSPWPVMLG